MPKSPEKIVLDHVTRETLMNYARAAEEMQARVNLIVQTVLRTKGISSDDYRLTPDFTVLVRVETDKTQPKTALPNEGKA